MSLEKLLILFLIFGSSIGYSQEWDQGKIDSELELLQQKSFIPADDISDDRTSITKKQRQRKSVDNSQIVNIEDRYFNSGSKELSDSISTMKAAPIRENQKQRER